MFQSADIGNYVSNKKISIFPRNQGLYGRGGTEGKSNIIRFNIPAFHGYILPNQCYLKFNFQIDDGTIGEVQPDPSCGFHSLIQTVRVTSGDGSALIEELDDYNSLQSSIYQYTKNQSIENKRILNEGVSPNPTNATFNLFNEVRPAIQTEALGRPIVEGFMPINTGSLSLNPKILPVVGLNGLDIELQLDEMERSLIFSKGRYGAGGHDMSADPDYYEQHGVVLNEATLTTSDQIEIVYLNKKAAEESREELMPRPVFDVNDDLYDKDGNIIGTILEIESIKNLIAVPIAFPQLLSPGSLNIEATADVPAGATSFTINRTVKNGAMFPTVADGETIRLPFVGTQIEFEVVGGSTETVSINAYDASTGLITFTPATVGAYPVLTSLIVNAPTLAYYSRFTAGRLSSLTALVGQPVTADYLPADTKVTRVQLSVGGTETEVFFDKYCIADQVIGDNLISNSTEETSFQTQTITLKENADEALAAGDVIFYDTKKRLNSMGYTMRDVQLITTVVNPPDAYTKQVQNAIGSSKGLNLDIKTYSTYRNNILDKNGITSSLIPAIQTRAYSCLSLPLNNNNQRTLLDSAFYPYTTGQQSYQYIHSNRLIPDREVDIKFRRNMVNINPNEYYESGGYSAIYTNEIDKAITNCGYFNRNLRNQQDHFLIGRGFSKQGQVYNLKSGDLSLRIFYINSEEPRLMLNYICNLNRINITNNGITVIQ